jgi:hypothetical protein
MPRASRDRLLEDEGATKDHSPLARAPVADDAGLGIEQGERVNRCSPASGRPKDVRIGARQHDEIAGAEGLHSSTVDDQLAAALENDVDAAQLCLAERYRPGRTELDPPVPGAFEPQVAENGAEDVHFAPMRRMMEEFGQISIDRPARLA